MYSRIIITEINKGTRQFNSFDGAFDYMESAMGGHIYREHIKESFNYMKEVVMQMGPHTIVMRKVTFTDKLTHVNNC